jgi:WD40 repeat protein
VLARKADNVVEMAAYSPRSNCGDETMCVDPERRASMRKPATAKLKQFVLTGIAASWLVLAGSVLPMSAGAGAPNAGGVPQANKGGAKDLAGDPLPAGAVARLGTLRWRQSAPADLLTLLPDGKTAVSAGDDHSVRVWDLATGKELHRFGSGAAVKDDFLELNDMVFVMGGRADSGLSAVSPDGKLLATQFEGREVVLWDLHTGKKSKAIKLPQEFATIVALAFAPDGKQLTLAGEKGPIRVWDLESEKFVLDLQAAPRRDNQAFVVVLGGGRRTSKPHGLMVYAPDGNTVAVVLVLTNPQALGIKFWDPRTGKELRTIKEGPRGSIHSPAFSPDSKLFAYSKSDGEVVVTEMASGKVLHKWRPAERADVVSLAFAADSRKLYTKGNLGDLREWDVETGKELRRLGAWVTDIPSNLPSAASRGCLALSADGNTLAIGGDGLALRFVDLATGQELPAPSGHTNRLASATYTPDGKSILTQGADRTLRLWDPASAKEVKQLPLMTGAVSFCASRDGRVLAVEDTKAVINLIDGTTGDKVATIGGQAGSAPRFVFSPDGKTLAVRRKAEMGIVLYDVPTGKMRSRVAKEVGNGRPGQNVGATFAFSQNGQRLAVFWGVNSAAIFDVQSGSQLHKFDLPKGMNVSSVAFAPDERTLAIDTGNGKVSVLEVATAKVRQTFGKVAPKKDGGAMLFIVDVNDMGGGGASFGQPGVATVAFSPDGHLLAFAGQSSALTVADLAADKEVAHFEGHQASIGAVAFSADGNTVVTGSADTTALIWSVKGLAAKPVAAQPLDAEALQARWTDLTNVEATTGWRAINHLVSAPQQVVALCQAKLEPTPRVEAARIEELVEQIGSEVFKVRQKAQTELARLGEVALPQLRKALTTNLPLEARLRLEDLEAKAATLALSGERLRMARAIEILERIGTPEAREVLQKLASGAPGALPTVHGQAALRRLQ